MDKPPLTPAMFGILLALVDADRHGLGIVEEIERRTSGDTTLAIGTLYRSIARLCEDGLITPVRRPARDHVQRRIYYRISDRGRHALEREAQRLDRLVRWARQLKTVPRPA